MTEEQMKQLKRRFVWWMVLALVFESLAVTLLMFSSQVDFGLGNIKPVLVVFIVSIAIIVFGVALYLVRMVVAQKLQDFEKARRRHEPEGGNV